MDFSAEYKEVRLQWLAELDHHDQCSIAQARERLKVRQLERVALQGNHNKDNLKKEPESGSKFESLLEAFRSIYDSPEAAEHVLHCPKCGRDDIEDPVLVDCLHVYCMECFTHLLHKCRNKSSITFVQCLSFESHHIRDCIELDSYQWDAIRQSTGGANNVQYTAMYSAAKSMLERAINNQMCNTGDVEILWNALDWRQSAREPFESPAIKQEEEDVGMQDEVNDTTDDSDDELDEGDRPNEYEEDSGETESEPETDASASEDGNILDEWSDVA